MLLQLINLLRRQAVQRGFAHHNVVFAAGSAYFKHVSRKAINLVFRNQDDVFFVFFQARQHRFSFFFIIYRVGANYGKCLAYAHHHVGMVDLSALALKSLERLENHG